jgi:hypothetical protein
VLSVLVIPIFINVRTKFESDSRLSKSKAILKAWEECTLNTYLAGGDPVAECGRTAPKGVYPTYADILLRAFTRASTGLCIFLVYGSKRQVCMSAAGELRLLATRINFISPQPSTTLDNRYLNYKVSKSFNYKAGCVRYLYID